LVTQREGVSTLYVRSTVRDLSTLFAFCAITYLLLEEGRVVIKRKERSLLSTFFIDSKGLGPLPTYP